MAAAETPNRRTLHVTIHHKRYIYHHLGIAPLIWHSPLTKTLFIKAKHNKKTAVYITLPDVMNENRDIIYILCGNFQSSIYYIAPGAFIKTNLMNGNLIKSDRIERKSPKRT